MAQAAARLNDPIGHSPTMSWLLGGLIAAAAIAVTAVAVVSTGGLAAAAIIGGAAAAGGGIGEVMSTMSWAPKEEVGNITTTGSPNVYTNGLRAIRAHLDTAKCDKHTDTEKVATGSGKVFINGWPAARVDDKTTCSATITKGSPNVNIGGDTVQTDDIHAEDLVPTWVHVALFVVGAGAAVVLAGPVVAAGGLAGGILGGMGGGWVGGKIFGEGSDGQKWSMLGGGLLGGFLGAKGAGLWKPTSVSPKAAGPGDDVHPNADVGRNPFTGTGLPRNTDRLLLNQGQQPTCGQNSMAMIMDTLGKPVEVGALIGRVPPAGGGTTMPRMVSLFRSEDVKAMAWTGRNVNDVAKYTSKGVPIMAVIADNPKANPPGFLHYVVVDGVTTRNGVRVVAIRDPHGKQYFQPVSKFEQHFTGEVIVPRNVSVPRRK